MSHTNVKLLDKHWQTKERCSLVYHRQRASETLNQWKHSIFDLALGQIASEEMKVISTRTVNYLFSFLRT